MTASSRTKLRALAVTALFGLIGAFLPATLHSASVSPMAVYLDSRARTGTMTLFNAGTRAEEIRIDFAFGYPRSDAQGNLTVPLSAKAPEGEPSAAPWLTAFPRRLVLEPGQRQVVRIMARPPAGLTEGEYWARALIHATGGQEPIEATEGGVGLQIDVETVTVVAVNYRNGDVSTGLTVEGAFATARDDGTVATIDFARTGNAAFLGRVLVEALDADGEVIGSEEQVLAVYHTLRRRIPVTVPAGETAARVRFVMDTNRSDLPPGGVIPTERVVHEVAVR